MDAYIAEKMSKEHEYNALRQKKLAADRQLRQYFWIQLIISVVLFVLALFASADMSRNPDLHGPGKWFWAINAAGIQIILSLITLMFGFIAGSGKRWATFALVILYGGVGIWATLSKQVALRMGNLFIAAVGIALNLWVQKSFSTDEMLKEFPGYPLFLVNAEKSEYHPSLVVTGRQASDHMETVEGFEAAESAKEKPQLMPSADTVLDEIQAPERQAVSGQTLSAPADAVLEQVGDAAKAGRAEQKLPELSPDVLLSDMSEGTGYPHAEAPAALPDPEEVRARLAAMRDARLQSESAAESGSSAE